MLALIGFGGCDRPEGALPGIHLVENWRGGQLPELRPAHPGGRAAMALTSMTNSRRMVEGLAVVPMMVRMGLRLVAYLLVTVQSLAKYLLVELAPLRPSAGDRDPDPSWRDWLR